MPPIYLDHHATTPVDPAVLDAMLPFFGERYGNAASQHVLGQEAREAVAVARGAVAQLIGASPEEVLFTSGATEANNLALKGVALPAQRGHVVATAIEHPSVLETCRALEALGYDLTLVPVPEDGVLRIDDVARALRGDTLLVSVMAANNEVGTLQPLARVGQLCRECGVVFHCDAAQAAGRIPIDVGAWGVDLLTLSAHKVYGPKGVGALYVRRGRRPRLRLAAQLHGGGQERGLRSGTLNTPAIVGMGVAFQLARRALAEGEPERLRQLRDRLLAGLRDQIEGVEVNGSLDHRLCGNLNLSIARVDAEVLLQAVGQRVALSAGSACAEAGGKGSHVLRALGLSDARVHTALRFGLGRYNTPAEVDAVLDVLVTEAVALRARLDGTRIDRRG